MKLLYISLIFVLVTGLIVNSAYANISPLQQYNSGKLIDEISCKTGSELVIKHANGKPACVYSDSKMELIKRGWTMEFKISDSLTINAASNEIWNNLRTFDNLEDWLVIWKNTELEGKGIGTIRTLISDSETLVERLDQLDDKSKIITYSILETVRPVEDFKGVMRVIKVTENESIVEWYGTFTLQEITEQEGKDMIGYVLDLGLNGLKELHENKISKLFS